MRLRERTDLFNRQVQKGESAFGAQYNSIYTGGTRYYKPYSSLADYRYNNGNVSYLSAATFGSSERMTDVGGPRTVNNLGVPDWQPVTHTKTTYSNHPHTSTGKKGSWWNVRKERYSPFAFSGELPTLNPYDNAVLYGECYNDLLPQFEGDITLANFIYELKDFKSLLKHFRSGRDAISSMADDIKGVVGIGKLKPRRKRNETMSRFLYRRRKWEKEHGFNMLNVASDMDLQYHYALKPLIRDTAMMSLLWDKMDKKIAAINKQGSVRNVHHAQRDIHFTHSASSTRVDASRGVYRLTSELTYRLKQMSRMSALMSYYGLAGTPSTLWNMIPFTFVLEHFTNLGEAVAGLDRSMVDYNMTRLLESYKMEECIVRLEPYSTMDTWYVRTAGNAGVAASLLSATGVDVSQNVPIAASYRQSYKRSLVTTPNLRPVILPRLQIPTMHQMRLDLDLVYQVFGRGQSKSAYRTG